jgi:hypothetical protein
MTVAGSINPSWLENARANLGPGITIEKWFSSVADQQVIIDATGGVWLVKSQRWMSQDGINHACGMIDGDQLADR